MTGSCSWLRRAPRVEATLAWCRVDAVATTPPSGFPEPILLVTTLLWSLVTMALEGVKLFAFEETDFPFTDVWISYEFFPKRLI